MTKLGIGISLANAQAIVSAPPAIVPDTLNPNPTTQKSVTLFSNNTEARITLPIPNGTTYGSAKSLTPKSTGKFYIEGWRVDNVPGGGYIGFGLSSISPASASINSGLVFYTVSGPASGIPTRLAIDISAGKLWYSLAMNGDWAGGGNPETGVGANATFTPGSNYSLFVRPMTISDSYGLLEARVRINFGADAFYFTKPTGYNIWSQ